MERSEYSGLLTIEEDVEEGILVAMTDQEFGAIVVGALKEAVQKHSFLCFHQAHIYNAANA